MSKRIALVAHDAMKNALMEWVKHNINALKNNWLICTGTTGTMVADIFSKESATIDFVSFKECVEDENIKTEKDHTKITLLHSGPLGGDSELGALIANEKIDYVIFFTDNLSMQAHDSDIKALSRLSAMYNIPTACNRATADFLITSTLFNNNNYQRLKPNFNKYLNRKIV